MGDKKTWKEWRLTVRLPDDLRRGVNAAVKANAPATVNSWLAGIIRRELTQSKGA